MKIQHHIVSSALIASILYLFFKSWNMALICFLSGILIDLDHIYDYTREFGFPFKIKDFFNTAYDGEVSRWTVVLHSWEVLFLIGIIAWFTNWNPWITGVLVGFGHHIVLDMLDKDERLRSYSFIWRWKNNFEFEVIFPNTAITIQFEKQHKKRKKPITKTK